MCLLRCVGLWGVNDLLPCVAVFRICVHVSAVSVVLYVRVCVNLGTLVADAMRGCVLSDVRVLTCSLRPCGCSMDTQRHTKSLRQPCDLSPWAALIPRSNGRVLLSAVGCFVCAFVRGFSGPSATQESQLGSHTALSSGRPFSPVQNGLMAQLYPRDSHKFDEKSYRGTTHKGVRQRKVKID